MSANDKIMEALARLEHKVDLALHLSAAQLPIKVDMKAVGDPSHKCPVCKQTPDYQVDIQDSVVVRKCGCGTGKIPLDLKAFAPPVMPAKNKEEDNGGTDEEDRSNTTRRGGRPGRR